MTKPKGEKPDGTEDGGSGTEKKATPPDEQAEFAGVLKLFQVKADRADSVAAYVVMTGGEGVLGNRDKLTAALNKCSEDITSPLRRKNILDYWCTMKQVPAQAPAAGGAQPGGEGADNVGGDLQFTVKDDAAGEPRVQPVQGDKEQGTTYAKANQICQQMKKDREGRGKLLVISEETGKYIPNMDNPYVQQNLSMIKAYAKDTNENLGLEVPPDAEELALAEMERKRERDERWRTVMGGGSSTIEEATKLLKALQDVAGGGAKAGVDPGLQTTLAGITSRLDSMQTEMTNRLHAQEMAEKDREHKAEIAQKDQQLGALRTEVGSLRESMTALGQKMDEVKGRPGKGPYDIISEAVGKLPNREDLRAIALEVAGKTPVVGGKSAKETETELAGLVGDMEHAAYVEELREGLFGQKP